MWPGRRMPEFRREMLSRPRLSHANVFWSAYGTRPFGCCVPGPSTMSHNFRAPVYSPVFEAPMPHQYSMVMVFLMLVALGGESRCPNGFGRLNADVADAERQEQDEQQSSHRRPISHLRAVFPPGRR